MGTRQTKITLHGVTMDITEDQLGVFFSQFRQVGDVATVVGKMGIATGDCLASHIDLREFLGYPRHSNLSRTQHPGCGRRPLSSLLVLLCSGARVLGVP